MAPKNKKDPYLPKERSEELDRIVVGLLSDKPKRFSGPTYIQDPIWGEIKLHGHEVALLNTKLMQRLRRIKQLGSVHLAFPGATHTRFDHSIGVLEQTDRMCDGLNEGSSGRARLVTAEQRINLRFAALCHDLGHGPFSHYSELFYPQLGLLRGPGAKKRATAEELSALIVKSKPFRAFCKKISKGNLKLNPDFIAKAITGDLGSNQKYLGEIIHGPFDADKIDYLMRDAQYCGMPIKVDTQHIHRSLTTYVYDRKRHLVGEPRAAAALFQLVHHRQHMFAVVYWHRTARISKSMLLNALRCVREQKGALCGHSLESAINFLNLDDEMLLAPSSTGNEDAAELLDCLRNRKLFKTAMKINAWVKKGKKTKMMKRIENDSVKLAAEIADKAGVKRHLVALDPVKPVGYKEAREMRLIQDGKLKRLGDIMKVKKEGVELQKFLNHHLLCCPEKHVKKVRKAAKELKLRELKT